MKKIFNIMDKLMESNILLWLIVLAGSLVHGLFCFGRTIWLDEALTGTYIRMGWVELLAFTTTDVHPPLYYFIVKLGITLFGDHLYVVKLFSYLPFVLMLIMTATKVRKEYGNRTAFLLTVLFCITPCIIERNAEMRMYQWAMFFVFAFMLYLYQAARENKPEYWLFCAALGLLAAYTHYYALVTVAILYAIVFFSNFNSKNIRNRILINAGISIVGYLPWLIVFLRQAKTINETGWWQEAGVTISQIWNYIVFPFVDRTGYEPYLFIVLLICMVFNLASKKEVSFRAESIYGMVTYFLFIILGVLIIVCYQPVFIARFIYPAVGVLLFSMAICMSRWRTEVICIIGVCMLFFGAKTYNSHLHYQYNEDSTPQLQVFMENVDEKETLIVCDEDPIRCMVSYLHPEYQTVNEDMVRKEDILDKEVYYFVSKEENINENELGKLGLTKYEEVESIYFLHHGFTIYRME